MPPLSASVLRMSNGAFYGSSYPVDSIAGAIHKIGLREIVRLVSTYISRQVFLQDLTCYGISAKQYWTYSYFCASLLEWLVQERADRVLAYLFGLFHCIGAIGIEKSLQEWEDPPHRPADAPFEVWEKATVGFCSDGIGAAVLKDWGFDETLTQLVASQFQPELSSYPHLTHCLRSARDIAYHNAFDIRSLQWEVPDRPNLYQPLKLSREALQSYVDASLQGVQSMATRIR